MKIIFMISVISWLRKKITFFILALQRFLTNICFSVNFTDDSQDEQYATVIWSFGDMAKVEMLMNKKTLEETINECKDVNTIVRVIL